MDMTNVISPGVRMQIAAISKLTRELTAEGNEGKNLRSDQVSQIFRGGRKGSVGADKLTSDHDKELGRGGKECVSVCDTNAPDQHDGQPV